MGAKRRMTFDKTEIVLMTDKSQILNLTYDQIVRIQFDKCIEKKLFSKFDSEKIEIMTRKQSEPVIYYKSKEKEFFEEYKEELAKFAKANRITFINNL
jgi:hypothetical protein